MCGIAGIVRADGQVPARESLLAMAGALKHRGPDEFGIYRDHRAGLAHARLSIIDLATGQQPLANEDESLWVVFNGEIFNYVELREQLAASGHRFRTRSDTEVIVHAYEQWGDDAFPRFNGQWSIALWDSRSGTLTLARDPYGIVPMFLAVDARRVAFASEVKALFAGEPTMTRRLDPDGIDQLFTTWTTVAPRTVFEGIEELEPGAVRVYQGGRLLRHLPPPLPAYPRHQVGEFQGSLDEAVEAVRHALDASTSLRMLRSDVPVGSYLSGGLDSSLVAALGLRAKGQRFSTFSLRFEDREYDETAFQRCMSDHLGTEHHELVVTRADIARVFPDVIRHAERPILRTAPAPMFLLSRLVREQGTKVVLTGEGADEAFAGYDIFREAKVRRFWARRAESTSRPRLLQRLYPYLERSPVAQQSMARQFFGQRLDRARQPGFGHDLRWNGASALKRFFAADFKARIAGTDAVAALLQTLPGAFADWSPLAQDQFLEVHTLMSGYLLSAQGDRMLMGNSVEGRFPFLDPQVSALAESLPPEYKLRVLDEKHVLKRAAAGLVPQAVLDRPKQPYRAPDALSFAEPVAEEWIEAVADEASLREAGVFDPVAARGLIRKCRERASSGQFSNGDNMAVVGILSTQLVHDAFIRHRPEGEAVDARTIVDRVSADLAPAR